MYIFILMLNMNHDTLLTKCAKEIKMRKSTIWNHHQVITDLLLFTVILRQGPFASPLAGERSVGDTLSCWEISNRLNLFIDLFYSIWIIIVTIVTIVTIARCVKCWILCRPRGAEAMLKQNQRLFSTLNLEVTEKPYVSAVAPKSS